MIGGVPSEHVRQAGFDAHAHQGEQPLLAPLRVGGQLGGPERLADLGVRVGRVRPREIHGHVHVGAAGLERRLEDGVVQTGVAGVDDDVDFVGLGQGDDLGLLAGVNLGGGEAGRVVEDLEGVDAALFVDVGQHEGVKEGAGLGD